VCDFVRVCIVKKTKDPAHRDLVDFVDRYTPTRRSCIRAHLSCIRSVHILLNSYARCSPSIKFSVCKPQFFAYPA